MDREVWVEQMRKADSDRLGRKAEHPAISIEAPSARRPFDLERGFASAIEKLVVDAATVITVSQRQGFSSVPLGLNDLDNHVWEHARNACTRREIFQSRGGAHLGASA